MGSPWGCSFYLSADGVAVAAYYTFPFFLYHFTTPPQLYSPSFFNFFQFCQYFYSFYLPTWGAPLLLGVALHVCRCRLAPLCPCAIISHPTPPLNPPPFSTPFFPASVYCFNLAHVVIAAIDA